MLLLLLSSTTTQTHNVRAKTAVFEPYGVSSDDIICASRELVNEEIVKERSNAKRKREEEKKGNDN